MSDELIVNNNKYLQNIGDTLEARITPKGKKVIKLNKPSEDYKYSETYYKNKVVRTESKPIKKQK